MSKITLATKFTIARIVLIVPTVIVYILGVLLGGDAYLPLIIISAVMFALLCGTDFIDGQIARKTNTVTDLGKFLDPLADKVVVVIMMFLIVALQDGINAVFAQNGLVIAVLSGIIVSRELMIGVFRAMVASKGLVLAADIYGKLKTVCLNIGITMLMLAGLHTVIAWIGTVVFYLGAALTVVSGLNYIFKNKHVFDAPNRSDGEADNAESDSDGDDK